MVITLGPEQIRVLLLVVRASSVIHRTISRKFVKRIRIQKCVPKGVDFWGMFYIRNSPKTIKIK